MTQVQIQRLLDRRAAIWVPPHVHPKLSAFYRRVWLRFTGNRRK